MESVNIILIFFPYGLTFFSLGIILIFEKGRGFNPHLQFALGPLAIFGLSHGFHEWIEMFFKLNLLPFQGGDNLGWHAIRVAILAFSFLSLAVFGASTISPYPKIKRLTLFIPFLLAAIWGLGFLNFRGQYGLTDPLWLVADGWTRYIIAIPASVLAATGLIAQQRSFRDAGMDQFGRDSMWAAIAFLWYGIIGQIFVPKSLLPLSKIINQEQFSEIFHFPVQLLRAAAGIAVAIFVIRFLRSFEVERQIQLDELQNARLEEAQRREMMRGELLRQVVDAQESERIRIARELHDSTGQSLTALGMGIRGVSSKLSGDDLAAVEKLNNLESLAVKSLDDLRLFISDLRPSHLDEFGLRSALRWYVGDIVQRAAFTLSLDVPPVSGDLPASVKTALFRVAQEAITNIIKHAKANNVNIRLEYRNNGDVRLEVEDDGIGFNPNLIQMMNNPTWGLLGMKERTILCGGEFSLRTAPNEGTIIQVTIPGTARINIKEDDENKNLLS